MEKNKAKLFDIRHFPMDMGRIVCSSMPLWFRLRKIYVSDKAKEKIRNGALIAANHTNFYDPLTLGCCFWYRRMFFLTAEVVMQKKSVSGLLKGMGCIEIDRSICDMDAIRKAVSVLKEGHMLSVFPQGGIDREENVSAIKSGIVLMAMQANVPIVPVYIYRKTKRKERNCIVIGEPIAPLKGGMMSNMADIGSYTELVLEKMGECQTLFEEIRRNEKW